MQNKLVGHVGCDELTGALHVL